MTDIEIQNIEHEIGILSEKMILYHNKLFLGKITTKYHNKMCDELAKRRDGLKEVVNTQSGFSR